MLRRVRRRLAIFSLKGSDRGRRRTYALAGQPIKSCGSFGPQSEAAMPKRHLLQVEVSP